MAVISGEVVRLTVRGTYQGSTVMYGHHFRNKTGADSLAGLAASYQTAVLTLLLAACSAEVTWLDIVVASTREGGDESHRRPLPAASIGTQTGDGLPGQNAMLVSVHTGTRGKRYRGRFYLPGISETSQTGGRIIAPQLTALSALAEGIQTAFTGSGNVNWGITVYSPQSPEPKVKPPRKLKPDTIDTLANDLIADSVIVTQRRRRLGVGA
jgi:hypothetical protein